ncbi:MAG: nicotinate-nucleotide--dimethylbenzimidazole phosphoribosyltransferase, partial [Acidimicrobiales bacterium]
MSEPGSVFDDAAARVRPVDAGAATRAQAHQNQLTKPPGSLGRLEAAGAQLAAIARHAPPPVPEPAVVTVFAGDHGVLAQGVSPWPAEVTAQMVANFC